MDLNLGGNADRWFSTADLRHRVGKELDFTAGLSAQAEWGQPVDWQATAGLSMRW